MKVVILTIMGLSFIATSSLQNAPDNENYIEEIISVASAYASSITCDSYNIDPQNVVSLVPYDSEKSNFSEAKYAVIWSGDIGCVAASSSFRTHITIVKVGNYDRFYVEPAKSSPSIELNTPQSSIRKVVGGRGVFLTLEAVEYGPSDAACCPSVEVSYFLVSDAEGNWNVLERSLIR